MSIFTSPSTPYLGDMEKLSAHWLGFCLLIVLVSRRRNELFKLYVSIYLVCGCVRMRVG